MTTAGYRPRTQPARPDHTLSLHSTASCQTGSKPLWRSPVLALQLVDLKMLVWLYCDDTIRDALPVYDYVFKVLSS